MEKVVVLGSTGSIGCQSLSVLSCLPDRYQIYALLAHQNVSLLLQQCHLYRPSYVILTDLVAAANCRLALRQSGLIDCAVLSVEELPDLLAETAVTKIMFAMSGISALPWMFLSARLGKQLLIANKEAFILAGRPLIEDAKQYGAQLIPVDSEHSALFQLFSGLTPPQHIRRVLLTASGGPFLNWSGDQLSMVTPEQACAHPTWRMGKKISIDSATLMNKGFELIEASLFFGLSPDSIDGLIHPQSIVHALLEYEDGTTLMHMSYPDMSVPIAYAFTHPDRHAVMRPSLSHELLTDLRFEPINVSQFPCFSIAKEVALLPHEFVIILQAANDYAVSAFLAGRMKFTEIASWIRRMLDQYVLPCSVSIRSADEIFLLNDDIHTFMGKCLL